MVEQDNSQDNLPKSVKMAGVTYKINKLSMKDGGEVLFHRAIVNISDEYTKDKAEEALFHEFMEIINEIYELELPHYKIQIMGSATHQLFKDNDLYFYEDPNKKIE